MLTNKIDKLSNFEWLTDDTENCDNIGHCKINLSGISCKLQGTQWQL